MTFSADSKKLKLENIVRNTEGEAGDLAPGDEYIVSKFGLGILAA